MFITFVVWNKHIATCTGTLNREANKTKNRKLEYDSKTSYKNELKERNMPCIVAPSEVQTSSKQIINGITY
jgi:hypothetical protein